MIKNVNTIEEYKDIDKINMLQQAGKTVRYTCSLDSLHDYLHAKDMGGYK